MSHTGQYHTKEISNLTAYTKPIKKENLPTNATTYQYPIHRWFNFIAGFSPEFVHKCCDEIVRETDAILLDPFAGCATAPLVASQRGLQAIGFEAHPVFARIGRAKLASHLFLHDLNYIEKAIIEGFDNPQNLSILPEAPLIFLSKILPEDSLRMLLGARESLKNNHLFDNDLAFLILSKVVELSSHSQTDGIYKAPTSPKKALSPLEAYAEVIKMIRSDINSHSVFPYNDKVVIVPRTSEIMNEVADDSVSIVVTSPPYLNNFDFAEMTRMLLYFWEIATSWGEITEKVRSKLIVNTTTSLKGHREKQEIYRSIIPNEINNELDIIVERLREQKRIKAGKKEYDLLIYPYFAQMKNVFSECYRTMKSNAFIHIMIADSALYGVHISTHEILVKILESLEFKNIKCSLIRQRGTRWIIQKREGSKQGLGEYHLIATK